MSDKFVLVVSDLHIGGAWSMLPEGFITSVGMVVKPENLNIGQRYLWECWQHFVEVLPQNIDVLVLNGDMCEGQSWADEGRGLTEVDPIFQAQAAARVLEPLVAKSKVIYLTQGSRYHTGRGGVNEEVLGQMIGAEGHEGHFTHAWLKFLVDGVYFDCSHRQSFTIRYRSMPLDREIEFMLHRMVKQRHPIPAQAVIIRSHTHSGYKLVEERGVMAIATPCWKLQDTFAKTSRSPNRLYPDHLGAVGLRVHEEEREGARLSIARYFYDHPEDIAKEAPIG